MKEIGVLKNKNKNKNWSFGNLFKTGIFKKLKLKIIKIIKVWKVKILKIKLKNWSFEKLN